MKTISGSQVVVVAVLAVRAFAGRQLGDLARGFAICAIWRASLHAAVRPGMRMSRKTMSGWPVLAATHLHGFQAVARLGHDLQLGPDLGQPRTQLVAHQALVVGQHGASRTGGKGVAGGESLMARALRPHANRPTAARRATGAIARSGRFS
jgi:hypothetical protein